MHNRYPLRGAKMRDALLWSRAIDEAIELFGGSAAVVSAMGLILRGRITNAYHAMEQDGGT